MTVYACHDCCCSQSMARNDGTPGPGTYTARPAIGVQPLSTNVSGPSCSLSPKAKVRSYSW